MNNTHSSKIGELKRYNKYQTYYHFEIFGSVVYNVTCLVNLNKGFCVPLYLKAAFSPYNLYTVVASQVAQKHYGPDVI